MDLLDKKIASFRQTATKEDKTVDKDCPLDLNPNPTCPRESVESVESDILSEEDTIQPNVKAAAVTLDFQLCKQSFAHSAC